MPGDNAALVREGYERFAASGEFVGDLVTDDFAWDMSHFHGWPEQQVYEGREQAQSFLLEWTGAWDEWELDVDALHEVGDKVLALVRQHGRSKTTGAPRGATAAISSSYPSHPSRDPSSATKDSTPGTRSRIRSIASR